MGEYTGNRNNQTSNNLKAQFNKLLRGLIQENSEGTYSAYNALYRLGKPVIKLAEEQLMKYKWADVTGESQINILSGLLSLIQDIDEVAAKRTAEAIKRMGCRPIVRNRIDGILSHTLMRYHQFTISGIHVCLHKSLGGEAFIRDRISTWLALIPGPDLRGIERLTIVPTSSEDHMGTYMPILCSIMIEWPAVWSRFDPITRAWLLEVEFTLYHEVGHHACGHEFGRDPENEAEADRYAQRLFDCAHPHLKQFRIRRLNTWKRMYSLIDGLRESNEKH